MQHHSVVGKRPDSFAWDASVFHVKGNTHQAKTFNITQHKEV